MIFAGFKEGLNRRWLRGGEGRGSCSSEPRGRQDGVWVRAAGPSAAAWSFCSSWEHPAAAPRRCPGDGGFGLGCRMQLAASLGFKKRGDRLLPAKKSCIRRKGGSRPPSACPTWDAWDQHPPLSQRSLPAWGCGLPAVGFAACFYPVSSPASRPGHVRVKAGPQHLPPKAGPSLSSSLG